MGDARTKPVPWCLVPTVVSFPSESSLLLLLLLLSPLLWRRPGRRGKLRPNLKLKPILRPRPMPGTSTAPTDTGPMATATSPTATLPTPTPATTATTDLATTWATTAGRRGRLPLRLMPTLLQRPTPGCCMAPTATDLPTEATTATATTTPPMPTSEAAVTILAVLSPVLLVDKEERRCQQKIKIDSWNHVLKKKKKKRWNHFLKKKKKKKKKK